MKRRTNKYTDRGAGYNVERLKQIARWCKDYNILFQMNTVVCRYNFDVDMLAIISEIAPVRGKYFQVLVQPVEKVQWKNMVTVPGRVANAAFMLRS